MKYNKLPYEKAHKIANKKEKEFLESKLKNMEKKEPKIFNSDKELKNETEFLNSFNDWYKSKGIYKIMNIVFSLPIMYKIPVLPNQKEPNEIKKFVILEVFEKIDQDIDAKIYLDNICKNADNYNVNIFVEVIPRYNQFLNNESKKAKITTEYLIDYYKKFGFKQINNSNEMMRKANDTESYKERGRSGK